MNARVVHAPGAEVTESQCSVLRFSTVVDITTGTSLLPVNKVTPKTRKREIGRLLIIFDSSLAK